MINQFYPFATAGGAFVLSNAAYAALAARASGLPPGIVPKENINSALRQGSFVAAALSQWIVDNESTLPVLDNGVVIDWETAFSAALTNFIEAIMAGTTAPLMTGLVLHTDLTVTVPAAGVFEVFDVAESGTQHLTTDFSSCIPEEFVFGSFQLGNGTPQVVTTADVYVNFPWDTPGGFSAISANVLPQGIWTISSVNYGKDTFVSNATSSGLGAALRLSSTLILLVSSADSTTPGVYLTAYNPATQTFGASVYVPSGAFSGIEECIGIYATGANSFICMWPTGAVAGTIAALAITTGTAVSFAAFENHGFEGFPGYGATSTQLSATVFLLAGFTEDPTNGDVAALVLTVAGTVITVGVPLKLTGNLLPNSFQIWLEATTPTSAIVGVMYTVSTDFAVAIIALAIGGTTISAGAPTVLANGIINDASISSWGASIRALPTAGTYIVLYPKDAGGDGHSVRVATVAGTGITLAAAVTSAHHTAFPIDLRPIAPYPYAGGIAGALVDSSGGALYEYSPTIFVVHTSDDFAIVYTATGTVITASAPVVCHGIAKAVDGTWFMHDAAGMHTFTVAGGVLVLGAAFTTLDTIDNFQAFSATMVGSSVKVGGNWYPYLVRTGHGFPLTTTGQAINVNTLVDHSI